MNCTALQDASVVPMIKERDRSADGSGGVILQIVTDDPLWLALTLDRAACITRDSDHPEYPSGLHDRDIHLDAEINSG